MPFLIFSIFAVSSNPAVKPAEEAVVSCGKDSSLKGPDSCGKEQGQAALLQYIGTASIASMRSVRIALNWQVERKSLLNFTDYRHCSC